MHRNVTLQHSLNDWRIAAAITKKYFNNYTNPNDYVIATKMKDKLQTVNRLETILIDFHIDKKRKDYTKISPNSVPDFPKLTINDIEENITFDPYQVSQAQSYIKENFKSPNNSLIELYVDNNQIFDNNTVLLRARIQSRHVSSKKYFTYVTYDKTIKNHTAIKDTICTCNTDKRTVGTCAHATSAILYLSNTRYEKTKKSTVKIDSIYSRHNNNYSDSETDNYFQSDNGDSSATIIDSDNAVIEENNHGNSPRHMTIYPDLSTIASTLQ